jgi:hypothetical protein
VYEEGETYPILFCAACACNFLSFSGSMIAICLLFSLSHQLNFQGRWFSLVRESYDFSRSQAAQEENLSTALPSSLKYR